MKNRRDSLAFNRLSQARTIALFCLLAIGCSEARKPENEKAVVPVMGVVNVDGAPLAGVTIKLHPKNPETTHRVFPKAATDADGIFVPWTYRKGDGLAVGEYILTFLDHSQSTPQMRASDRRDLFQGKYADPNTSKHTITVSESDESVDVGTIELTH